MLTFFTKLLGDQIIFARQKPPKNSDTMKNIRNLNSGLLVRCQQSTAGKIIKSISDFCHFFPDYVLGQNLLESTSVSPRQC